MELGPILDRDACAARLNGLRSWNGTAVYVLWDRIRNEPIYCGTANSPSRLKGHLHKDDLRNGPVGKTLVNPELRSYCLAQPRGWLGIQFRLFATEDEARAVERDIIATHGIRKQGGRLFNQRMSG